MSINDALMAFREKADRFDYLNDFSTIRIFAEWLESQPEFQNLVQQTADTYSNTPNGPSYIDLWRSNVADFFRNSKFYLRAYRRQITDDALLFLSYDAAFRKTRTTITYFVPLEFVAFDRNTFDFKTFRIVQLNREDLHLLLRTDITRPFYPYAYGDVSTLAETWLLEVKETVDAWEPGSGGPAGIRGAELEFRSTDFPRVVEDALKFLTLHDWGTYQAPIGIGKASKLIKELDTGWDRFHVPFVITVHDNLLWPPQPLPDMNMLSTRPDFDEEGAEIGERPIVSIWVEGEEFPANINKVVEFMNSSLEERSDKWLFFNTALNYVCKAFFAEGLEQLLWHLVAVEALLGDKADGLTSRLAKRTAFVVAIDEQERSRINKLIAREDGLYQLRSDLVHGNSKLGDRRVYLGHLREARELARRTVLWFLDTLNDFRAYQETSPVGVTTHIPAREEILAAIDVVANQDLDARCINTLITLLHSKQS
jgi:hypothetical protein